MSRDHNQNGKNGSSTAKLVLPRLATRSLYSETVEEREKRSSNSNDCVQSDGQGSSIPTSKVMSPSNSTSSNSFSVSSSQSGSSLSTTLSQAARKLIRQQSMRVNSKMNDLSSASSPLASAGSKQQSIERLNTLRSAFIQRGGTTRQIGINESENTYSNALAPHGEIPIDEEIEKFDWMSLIENPLKGKPRLIPLDRVEAGKFFFEHDPDSIPSDMDEDNDDDIFNSNMEEEESLSKFKGKKGHSSMSSKFHTDKSQLGPKTKFSDLITYEKLISFKESELENELASLSEQRARWDRKLARLSHQAQERERALLAKDQYLQKLTKATLSSTASLSQRKPGKTTSSDTSSQQLSDQEVSKLADMLRRDLGSGKGFENVDTNFNDISQSKNTSSLAMIGDADDADDAERIDDYFGYDVDTIIAHKAAELRQKSQDMERRRAERRAKRSRSTKQRESESEALGEEKSYPLDDEEDIHESDLEESDEEDIEEADDIDNPLQSLARLYKSWGIEIPSMDAKAADRELKFKDEGSVVNQNENDENPALTHLLERRLQGGLGAISAQLDDLMNARNELLKNVDLTGISDDEFDEDKGANNDGADVEDVGGGLIEHIAEPYADEDSSSSVFVTAQQSKR